MALGTNLRLHEVFRVAIIARITNGDISLGICRSWGFGRGFSRGFGWRVSRRVGRCFGRGFGRRVGRGFGWRVGGGFGRRVSRGFGRRFGRRVGRGFGRGFGWRVGRGFGRRFGRKGLRLYASFRTHVSVWARNAAGSTTTWLIGSSHTETGRFASFQAKVSRSTDAILWYRRCAAFQTVIASFAQTFWDTQTRFAAVITSRAWYTIHQPDFGLDGSYALDW